MDSQSPPASTQAESQSQDQSGKLTPDLIAAVTAKVYAMLRHDLKIEGERRRITTGRRSIGRM